MRISLPITNTIINPVTTIITKHSDTQKERLNCIAVKARNAMNASLTQKLKAAAPDLKIEITRAER
jgi:hypothetical protein